MLRTFWKNTGRVTLGGALRVSEASAGRGLHSCPFSQFSLPGAGLGLQPQALTWQSWDTLQVSDTAHVFVSQDRGEQGLPRAGPASLDDFLVAGWWDLTVVLCCWPRFSLTRPALCSSSETSCVPTSWGCRARRAPCELRAESGPPEREHPHSPLWQGGPRCRVGQDARGSAQPLPSATCTAPISMATWEPRAHPRDPVGSRLPGLEGSSSHSDPTSVRVSLSTAAVGGQARELNTSAHLSPSRPVSAFLPLSIPVCAWHPAGGRERLLLLTEN